MDAKILRELLMLIITECAPMAAGYHSLKKKKDNRQVWLSDRNMRYYGRTVYKEKAKSNELQCN